MDQFALASSTALAKIAVVLITVLPNVSTITVRFALLVLSNILISVGKLLLTSTVLQKIFEISPISRTAVMMVGPFTVLFVVFPLTLVPAAFCGRPYSVTFFLALTPLSLEKLTGAPLKFTHTVSFSMFERACICPYSVFLCALIFLSFFE